MAQYHKILVATDLAPSQLPVLQKAIILAKENNASLHVISVIPEVPFYLAEGFASLENIEDEFESEIKRRVQAVKQQLNLKADFTVKRGCLRTAVLQQVRQLKVDLLLVGSQKRDEHLSIGSTIQTVLHQADCDILVVRVSDDE